MAPSARTWILLTSTYVQFGINLDNNLINLHTFQTDAELWDALHRSFLVESPKVGDMEGSSTPTSRFNLDSVIESEGSNLSVGERSLLSLARALVKDSQVVGTFLYPIFRSYPLLTSLTSS